MNLTQHTAILSSGTTVYYANYTKPRAPLVVFIHGFRGTHHGLLPIAEELDYDIVLPDLPGFGESQPLKNDHTITDYVLWLYEFISKIGASRPIILVGHSFGSIVVSHFAAKHGTLITKLVLINPISAPALEGPKALLTPLAALYYTIGGRLPERAGRAWLSLKPVTKLTSIAMRTSKNSTTKRYIDSQHYSYFSRFYSAKILSDIYSTSISHHVGQVARAITTPTLFIVAENDQITDIATQHAVAKDFSSATIRVIPIVGHLVHYETPKQAANYIREFIS
ncbi:alpha/beta hydrolase [Candidatus Saccharibacteria bacterium]|nr:alpha/beta hydrolase [Candidatus Saccharibacteria bacterium]